MRANTPEDAILVAEDDVLLHLYTGRRAVPIGAFTPQDHMQKQSPEYATETLRTILQTYDVDYVVTTTPFGAHAAEGLTRQEAPQLKLAGALSLGLIYQTVPQAPKSEYP